MFQILRIFNGPFLHIYIYIYIFECFAADNHSCFLTDCSITLIDQTNDSDPIRREEYWRKVLKTVAPYGLNTLS